MRQLFPIALICACLAVVSRGSDVKLNEPELRPGTRIDLTGPWAYKPGYAIAKGESPEQSKAKTEGYFTIPVPQILNKIYWWLDDSEDFKKDEDARLKKLGFDTDKAEDGWYRKVIELPSTGLPKDTHIAIQFDGVAMRSDVYINGHKLGHHDGMFSRFEYDLTEQLKPGKNVLAVFVSMEKIPPNEVSMGEAVTVNLTASKVLTMSKGMFGPLSPGYPNRAYDLHGIWQPVRLVVRGGSAIDDVWFRPTPGLNGAMIDVDARALDASQRKVKIAAVLRDPALPNGKFELSLVGETLTATRKTFALKGGMSSEFKPWTPAEPNLYSLQVELIDDAGIVLDRWSTRVGFRTFEAKDGQLLLNGKPYWLRGANQLPYGKNPTDPKLARKLIQIIHDANIRFTRTHATPWNEAWLDAADEIGLAVSVEGMRPWGLAGNIGPTPPAMMRHWLMEQADVVRRIRNHPSVIIHTIGNEMMLRDDDNLEKWKQISEVSQLTRQLDPLRPIVVSSTYVRGKKQHDELLAPNKIDDGDIDDPHSYKSWYSNSPFVLDSKFEVDFKRRGKTDRPYMGQEFSTGYPDLDTGLPVMRYTRDLMTPQAWVGVYAYPGNDPKWFLEYNRAVTKRWVEQLRFQRNGKTSGFSLFSLECWFAHGYDAECAKPYPVLDAVRQAFSPLGLALQTSQRRFYAGEGDQYAFDVYVTNDDERCLEHAGLSLQMQLVDPQNGKVVGATKSRETFKIAYLSTVKESTILLPPIVHARTKLNLITMLMSGDEEVSRTVDPIELFPRVQVSNIQTSNSIDEAMKKAEAGETAIVFAPDMKEMLKRFPNDIYDDAKVGEEDFSRRVEEAKAKKQPSPKKPQGGFDFDMKKDLGEFVDWTPARGTKLVEGLEPMDLRWWARKDDWRAFVSQGSFRLKPDGKARELFRYIPSHGYIPAERVPWQMRTVLFEIPVGKGRLWVCNLNLSDSVGVDPVADIVARNLIAAASDANSTANLKPMPSHEEMLAGKLPR